MHVVIQAGATAAAVAAVLALAELVFRWLRRGLGLVDAIKANTAALGELAEKFESFGDVVWDILADHERQLAEASGKVTTLPTPRSPA